MALAFHHPLEEAPRRRIVLFPGAWNPPTIAHLAMARAALAYAPAVIWMMPREFPHKKFDDITFAQRLEMLRLIARCEPRFSVAVADGGLYAEMADEARDYFGPESEIALLCGKDAAERIAAWDYGRPGVFDEMLDKYPLLVAARAGEYLPHPRHAERVTPLAVNLDEVSSTEIRARMAAGEPWRHLVPAAIADIVEKLYAPSRSL
jgi:nicotinate-nucleotide adenylyltransferase